MIKATQTVLQVLQTVNHHLLRFVSCDSMLLSHVAEQSMPSFRWIVTSYVALVHQAREMLGLHVAPQVAGHLDREGAGGAHVEAAAHLVQRDRHLPLHKIADFCTEIDFGTRIVSPALLCKH